MIKKILAVLLSGITFLGISSCSSQKQENKTFIETTIANMFIDVQSIDFENLSPTEKNELIYKNIALKMIAIKFAIDNNDIYNMHNLSADNAETLCLANIYISRYVSSQPDILKDTRATVSKLQPLFIEKIKRSNKKSSKCLELLS